MELEKLGSTPISAQTPTGADVRYDPEFEALQAETDKTPTAGSAKDWKKVLNGAAAILENKSKDLLVAAYLGVALVHTRGLPGLAVSVQVMRDVIENFWDGLFPPLKRMRGRIQAMGWWYEETIQYLRGLENVPPQEPALLESLRELINGLDSSLGDKCPDAQSVRPLLDFLGQIPVLEEVPPEPEPAPAPAVPTPEAPAPASPQAPAPQPAPAPAQAPRPAPATPAAPPPPPPPAPTGDSFQALASVLTSINAAAEYLREAGLTNADAYRLNRIAAWFDIKILPPNEDGKTRLPAPDKQAANNIHSLIGEGNLAGALKSAEYNVSQFLFWLDMSRISHEILGQLGAAEAREAVALETAVFVKRVPGIENLTFADGTPFADEATRRWLKSVSLGRGGEDASQPRSGGDGAAFKAYAEALDMVRGGKATDGLTRYQGFASETGSGRERFTRRVNLLRLLDAAGMDRVAGPLAEELIALSEKFSLRDWEPELALDALKAAWQVFQAGSGDDSKANARETMRKIAAMSPVDAARLAGS